MRRIARKKANTSEAGQRWRETRPAGAKRRKPFFNWIESPKQPKSNPNAASGRFGPVSPELGVPLQRCVETRLADLGSIGLDPKSARGILQGELACTLGAAGYTLPEVTEALKILGLAP